MAKRNNNAIHAVIICFIVLLLLSLNGCNSKTENRNDTPEKLINNYLTAVKDKDYEAIWNMVPIKIQEYAIKSELIKDKEDGLEYIHFAVQDYYWLTALDLPAHDNFEVEIVEEHDSDKQQAQNYLSQMGITLAIDDAKYIETAITLENGSSQDADFWLIKNGNNWYMTSVVGDDEVFTY